MALYNTLADVGRIKMKVESVLLIIVAAVMITYGLYVVANDRRDRERRMAGLKVLGIGALIGLIAWFFLNVSKRTNRFSKLYAASSGAELFVAPWLA